MKILFNPINGAPISDLWIKDIYYLDSKKQEVFKPGQVLRFDDDAGEVLLELYGFLEELSIEEARLRLDSLKKNPIKEFACDFEGCDFSTDTKVAVFGHKRTHKIVKTEDDLGIPEMKGTEKETVRTEAYMDRFTQEDKRSGLDKGQLVEERL